MRTVVLGAGRRARSVATSTAPPPLTRRAVVRAGTAVVALAVLAGCTTGTGRTDSTPTPAAGLDAQPDLVMVIRHGEKPDDSHPGVDADGKKDDSSLTEIGWERAHRLVDLFDPAQGPAPAGAGPPDGDLRGRRERRRRRPADPRDRHAAGRQARHHGEHQLRQGRRGGARQARHSRKPGPTLISWQHGEIPAIAEAFPGGDADAAVANGRTTGSTWSGPSPGPPTAGTSPSCPSSCCPTTGPVTSELRGDD